MIISFGNTFGVAAPIGGKDGERATEIALRVFQEEIEAGRGVALAFAAANKVVMDDSTLRGAGCTMGVVQLRDDTAEVFWIGDVRVYRLRGDDVVCLTKDHSLLNDYAAKHNLTPEQRAAFPHKNVIVRALGMADAALDRKSEPRSEGDVLLVATDEVYSALGETTLSQILRAHRDDANACARELLESAHVNGGSGSVMVVPVGAADS